MGIFKFSVLAQIKKFKKNNVRILLSPTVVLRSEMFQETSTNVHVNCGKSRSVRGVLGSVSLI